MELIPKRWGPRFSWILLSLSTAALGAEINGPEQAVDALSNGSVALDLRYRYENVDEQSFENSAQASLLRTRLTLRSGTIGRLSALLEVDDVRSLATQDYNSTENGKTEFPVIADPEGTEINQASLRYATANVDATLGRQRILLDQGRFVGAKPWRQNEQTYDAVRLEWRAKPGLAIDASYVNQVNRVFGPADGSNPADWHGHSTFLRASYEVSEKHSVVGYAYLLDVDAQGSFGAGKTVNSASDTIGVAYRGVFSGVDLLARYATQTDAGASELAYRAPYYVIEVGVPLGGLRLKAAHEVLGADNGVGFGTPLANGHRYQGWADKFLATPGDGLTDTWVSLDGDLGPVALTARYHDFNAEASSARFGTEIDLQARWVINKWLTATAKAAVFNTGNTARYPDTTKAWLMLQLRL